MIPDPESMVLDFDGWLGQQDPATRGGLQEHLNSVPAPERDGEKQRLASMFSVAADTGVDLQTVGDNWDNVRGGYAEQKGGPWLAVKDNEGAFYQQLKAQAQNQRNERHLLSGPDDDKAPDAKQLASTSLEGLTFNAALLGHSAAQAFATWQQGAQGKPGFDPSRADAYFDHARQLHDAVTQRFAPVMELADSAFRTLSTGKDLQTASERLLPQVDQLSDDQRRDFLTALRVMADASPDQTKATFWGNFAKQAGRDVVGTGRSFMDFLAAAGGAQAIGDASLSEMSGAAPEGFQRGLMGEFGRALREHNLESDLRRVQEQDFSPVRDVLPQGWRWAERGAYAAPGALAFTAEGMLPGVGLPALFGTIAAQTYESERFRLMDVGWNDAEASQRAALLAPIAAVPQAALMELRVGALAGKFPALQSALNAIGDRAGSGALGYGARVAGHAGTQLALMQGMNLMQPTVEAAAAALDKDMPGVNWHDGQSGVLDGFWAKTGESFVSLLPLVLTGAAFTGNARTEALSKASDLQLRAFGAKPEDITAFRTAVEKGPSSAMDAAQALISNRDGNSPTAKAAVAQLAETERQRAAVTDNGLQSDMRETGVSKVVRDAGGWALIHDDGTRTQVGSDRAAVAVLSDLRQASSQAEASALVSIIDNWHSKAPTGTERETTLTGETARSEGNAITYTKEGRGVVREVTSPAVLDSLREEARMDAGAGNQDIDVLVNGSNTVEFRERVADGAMQVVQRLELNQSESTALTALHEQIEAAWREGIGRGTITLEETRRAIASVAEALDPERSRDAADKAFRERVQRVAAGKASDVETRETVSELAVADVLGRRRDGVTMPAGSITTALDAAIRNATTAADVRNLGKFRAFLKAAKTYFRGVLGTVAALRKSKREGGAKELSALVDKLTGLHDQRAHEDALASELEGQLPEYKPPTPEEEANGIAFSLGKVGAIGYVDSYGAVHAKPINSEEELGRVEHAPLFGSAAVAGADRFRFDRLGGVEWTRPPSQESKDALQNWLDRRLPNNESRAFSLSKPPAAYDELVKERGHPAVSIGELAERSGIPLEKMKEGLLDAWRQGKVVLSTGDWSLSDETTRAGAIEAGGQRNLQVRWLPEKRSFRLSASSRLDLIQRRLDDALARDPERRREIGREASRKLQALQFGWETERYTPKGDLIRPIEEQRTARELDKEQSVRQALRSDELQAEGMGGLSHETVRAYEQGVEKLNERPFIAEMLNLGKLVSKTTAARRGLYGEYDAAPVLPPSWYAGPGRGGMMPDEMAQALHDAGMLREPSPEALWATLESELQSYRAEHKAFAEASKQVAAVEKKARNQAREETAEWRREQDERQKADWAPRARLVRDLRTLDAVLSVLPPEVRGKVGGFVKLAQLGTDAARVEEIGRRIDKISGLLETHLKAETSAALDTLIERAQPKGGAGERAGGKIGVEGHRFFEQLQAAHVMSAAEVRARQDAIESQLSGALTDAERGQLLEEWGILQTYGNFGDKTAAEMDTALRQAQAVYTNGRGAWNAVLEQRAQERAALREQAITEIGAEGGGRARQDAFAEEAQGGQRRKLTDFFTNAHLSFAQRLSRIFGTGEITRRYETAVTQAYHEKQTRLNAGRTALRNTLLKAFGEKTWWKAQDKLLALQEPREKSGVMRLEGRRSEIRDFPVDVAQRIVDGSMSADVHGLPDEKVQELEELLAANERAEHPRQVLKMEVETEAGKRVEQRLSELQAVHLTMLARNEQYRAAMEHHGWDTQARAQLEAMLSPEAKAIRGFLADQYENGYAGLNEVFKPMFGIDLPKVENYAPGYFEHAGQQTEMDPFGTGIEAGGLAAGFLKSRKNHLAEPTIIDALQAFWQHTMQTEHWKSFAPVISEMRSVLGDVGVRHAIEASGGRRAAMDLSDWVGNIERNGVREAQSNAFLSRIMTGLTRARLSFNVGTWMKHLPNAFASLADVPAMDWMRGLGRVLSGQSDASLAAIWRSDLIRNRIELSFTPDLRQIMAGDRAQPSKVGDFLDWGVARIPWVASAFTTFSAAIAHDYHLRAAKEAGLTGAQAEEHAMRQTELTVARTAQPESIDRKSLAELDRKGVGKLAMMFVTPERQQLGLALAAVLNAKEGKISKGEAARVLFSTWVLAPVLMQTMVGLARYAFTDEDAEEAWDWRRYVAAVALGPTSGWFGIGQIAEVAASHFKGDITRAGGSPFVQAAQSIFSGAKGIEKWLHDDGELALKDIEHLATGLSEILSGVTDIPVEAVNVVDRLFRQAKAVLPDSEDDKARKEKRELARERRAALE